MSAGFKSKLLVSFLRRTKHQVINYGTLRCLSSYHDLPAVTWLWPAGKTNCVRMRNSFFVHRYMRACMRACVRAYERVCMRMCVFVNIGHTTPRPVNYGTVEECSWKREKNARVDVGGTDWRRRRKGVGWRKVKVGWIHQWCGLKKPGYMMWGGTFAIFTFAYIIKITLENHLHDQLPFI